MWIPIKTVETTHLACPNLAGIQWIDCGASFSSSGSQFGITDPYLDEIVTLASRLMFIVCFWPPAFMPMVISS